MIISGFVSFQFLAESVGIKLIVLPSEVGEDAVLLHEAVIDKANFIWEIAMDKDYILFLYNRHDSLYSEIQIRSTSTFQVLNNIVLDDGNAKTLHPYVFHYLNGLIVTSFNNKKWIR